MLHINNYTYTTTKPQSWLCASSAQPMTLATALLPLERAGFRADKLSVWVLQGYPVSPTAPLASLQRLLVETTGMAAFGSIVAGQLPPLPTQQASNLLGEFGLLGPVRDFGSAGADYAAEVGGVHGAWARLVSQHGPVAHGEEVPRLFCAQHTRLSLVQMQVRDDHIRAAEEAGEDFFGNFS